MSRTPRILGAALLGVVGAIAALFLAPSGVAGCLGPIGVTSIQCAHATGIYPSVGMSGPILAGVGLMMLLLLGPGLLRPHLHAVALAGAGSLVAGLLYMALRPRTWTGPISTGLEIRLSLPLDGWALATAAIVGATMGFLLLGVKRRAARDRGPRTEVQAGLP
jgi:hypothetical protein